MEKNISIASEQKNIRVIENLIEEICSKMNINNEIYGKVLVAAIEAVNNAIVHGNKSNPEKKVEINLAVNNKEMHIFISDEGEGFDYENVPDPTSPENIENIHGRGVFLMIKLSDEVHFFENGSKVELIFYI